MSCGSCRPPRRRRADRCEALVPASTYSEAHRCEKRLGIQRVGELALCAHHRGVAARGALVLPAVGGSR